MKIQKLDGPLFFSAAKKGAEAIFKNRETLNTLNFFPVPDSDTGNNLTVTLSGTLGAVEVDASFSRTLASMAEHVVRSARGNSGLILAQFIQGLHEVSTGVPHVSTRDFSHFVSRAVPAVYEAVEDPVEGTMITLIREWGEALQTLSRRMDDFRLLLASALVQAKESLDKTKDLLHTFKGKKSVDAGALGFYLFLEGMAGAFEETSVEGPLLFQEAPVNDSLLEDKEIITDDIPYRYCTEVYFSSSEEPARLHALLRPMGDSLIIAGGEKRYRLHIHTNTPWEVMGTLVERGTVFSHKVDDMQREADVNHRRKAEVAIVTDSAADIPRELADFYQIHMIPLNILYKGVSFQDKLTLSPEQLYAFMESPAELPSSSQPSVEAVRQRLAFLARHYRAILVLSVAKELSGTYHAFVSAAEEIEKEFSIPVRVVDTRLNSGAQGLLVIRAAEAIEQGRSFSEVETLLEDEREKTGIIVALDNLRTMIRGGRLSTLQGWAARSLHLIPLVTLDHQGKGALAGKSFTRAGSERTILKRAQEAMEQGGIGTFAVVHSGAEERARALEKKLASLIGFPALFIMEISSGVALNAGLGAVAFCYRAAAPLHNKPS